MEPRMKSVTGFESVLMSRMLKPPERDDMEMRIASSQQSIFPHPPMDWRYEKMMLHHRTTYTQIKTRVNAELKRCVE